MWRLLPRTPIILAVLAASLAVGLAAFPVNASAASGTVRLSATILPSIRMTLGSPTAPLTVKSARGYDVTLAAVLDSSGAEGEGLLYTVVPR